MDANSKYGPFNHDIVNAVLWLKGNGIIARDKDIADRTEYSKGTVSSYINGNKEASEDFRKKFEETFKLNLEGFQTKKPIAGHPPAIKTEHEKYVALLEKSHNDKDADLIALRKAVDNINVIDKRVSDIESTVSGFSGRLEDAEANVADLREFVIRQIAKIRRESTAKVAAELGSVSVELLRKNQKKDTQHDLDK